MQKAENRVCGKCGSSNLISDRSLGGKIVCVRCGSSFIKTRRLFISSSKRNFYYFLLILLVIFLVVLF